MTLLYEILYLPTNSGTIRIDLSYKRSSYTAHAELGGHLSMGKDRSKRKAIKKSLMELAKQVHSD